METDILVGSGSGRQPDAVQVRTPLVRPSHSPWQAPIRQVVSDDFNGDGKPDAVVLASDQASVISVLNILLPGVRRGISATYSSGYHPNYVTTGDLNGDGIADVGYHQPVHQELFQRAAWKCRWNTSAPRFSMAVLEPHMPLLADFNGDGIADLAIAELEGDRVSIRLGNGNGTFQLPLERSCRGARTGFAGRR